MSLKNCERCGRLFFGVEPVCPACEERDQEEFVRVRDYLRAHPDAALLEVSAATGVHVDRLHRWAEEGRLELKWEETEESPRCQRCGAPIKSGRLCSQCAAKLMAAAERASRPSQPQPAPPAQGAGEAEGRPPPKDPGRSEPPPAGKSRPQVHTIEDIRRRFR